MDSITFVTHNKGKVASAQKYFKKAKLEIFNYDLDEPRSDDLKEIATCKVKEAYELVKKPCIALDAGFFIDELNGFPRAFVNFALETIGIDGILKLMENVENRSCAFRECLAYYDGKEIKYFYGESKGTLTLKREGIDQENKWSELWYIFKPLNCDKTLAQMEDVERGERRQKDGSSSSIEEFAKWYEGDR